MAVQKNKKSRAKRDTRRAHDQLSPLTLTLEKASDEKRIRHHVSDKGFYRGVQYEWITKKNQKKLASNEDDSD